MGLPKSFYDDPKPFGEQFRERFVQTVVADDDFRVAAVATFKGQT